MNKHIDRITNEIISAIDEQTSGETTIHDAAKKVKTATHLNFTEFKAGIYEIPMLRQVAIIAWDIVEDIESPESIAKFWNELVALARDFAAGKLHPTQWTYTATYERRVSGKTVESLGLWVHFEDGIAEVSAPNQVLTDAARDVIKKVGLDKKLPQSKHQTKLKAFRKVLPVHLNSFHRVDDKIIELLTETRIHRF